MHSTLKQSFSLAGSVETTKTSGYFGGAIKLPSPSDSASKPAASQPDAPYLCGAFLQRGNEHLLRGPIALREKLGEGAANHVLDWTGGCAKVGMVGGGGDDE